MGLQSALAVLYPAQCLSCGGLVAESAGLCGACWRDAPFLSGLLCDLCGASLPGDDPGEPVFCDDCRRLSRPWDQGRSVFRYEETGRKLILGLKHGGREEIVAPAARWMARAAGPMLAGEDVLVPVPLHWMRLLRRRFNQSALLAWGMSGALGVPCIPDALVRTRRTRTHRDMAPEERFANLTGAIAPHPKRGAALAGKSVILVDDVMTSGATLAACSAACFAAGAERVCIQTLARVATAN